MKIILILLLGLNTLSASEKYVYVKSGIWMGNNIYSSAPAPYCPCDTDWNKKDCPKEFTLDYDLGEVCYDEFLPSNTRGWAHGVEYRRQKR